MHILHCCTGMWLMSLNSPEAVRWARVQGQSDANSTAYNNIAYASLRHERRARSRTPPHTPDRFQASCMSLFLLSNFQTKVPHWIIYHILCCGYLSIYQVLQWNKIHGYLEVV